MKEEVHHQAQAYTPCRPGRSSRRREEEEKVKVGEGE